MWVGEDVTVLFFSFAAKGNNVKGKGNKVVSPSKPDIGHKTWPLGLFTTCINSIEVDCLTFSIN